MLDRRRRAWIAVLLIAGGAGALFWGIRRHAVPGRAAGQAGSGAIPGERGRLGGFASDPEAPPGALEGLVKRPDGAPCEGARVIVVAAETEAHGRRVRPAGVARSDAQGRFRIEKLRPGEYGASATAPGLAPASRTGLLLLPGETLGGIELVLSREGVTIKGHVSDAGGGVIASPTIRAHRGGRGAEEVELFEVVGDAQGAYEIHLAKGQVVLEADAEGYAPEEKLVTAKLDQTVDFRLNPAATLRGRVVERGSGAPVGGAEVRLATSEWWADERRVAADAQGVFEFHDLDPGEYALSAQKGALVGHLPRRISVTLGGFTGDVTIALDRGRVVAGQVRTAAGAPVAAARLRLSDRTFAGGRGPRAQSGADGKYRLEGVLPGRYQVSARASGYAPALKEDLVVAEHDLEGVDLVLPAGAEILGRVLGKDGQPVAGAAVDAYTRGGGWMGRSWAADRSGADGSFHLKDLAAGEAHLEADHPDRGHAQVESVPLAAGEKKDLTLRLEDGASIAGTVRWDDGTPAAGINVSGFSRAGASAQARTAADGSYRLSPLGRGTVFVSASRKAGGFFLSGGGSQPQIVTLESNEHKTGVDLKLPKGGHRLSGLVVGPDGSPVANAGVGATPEGETGVAFRMRGMGLGGDSTVYTGTDGTFALEDLGAGNYTVYATHAGFPEAEVPHVPADATSVRVQLKPESVVAGVVQGAGGRPVADYTISVLPSQTQTDQGRLAAMMGSNRQSVHDPSGAFEVRGLGAGTYDLVVTTGDGHAGRLGGVTLGDGEQKRGLVVPIAQGVTLKGRAVELGTEAPLAGAMVLVFGTGQPQTSTTDAQGGFEAAGLPPGRPVQLTIAPDRETYLADHREITIPDGKDTVDLGPVHLMRGSMAQMLQPGATGIDPMNRDGRALCARVRPGSPAAAAGIREGDGLLRIGEQAVGELGSVALAALLGGAPGTQVTIAIAPAGGGAARQVTLTRVARSFP